jgi:hypothetical protein
VLVVKHEHPEQQTQAVAVVDKTLKYQTEQMAAVGLVLLLSDTPERKKVLAAQLPHLADTPSTHLHRLARLRHKEKLNGTFCKSC